MTRLRAMLLAIITAIGAGVGVREAVRRATAVHGFTCTDWQRAINLFGDGPDGYHSYRLAKPDCPSLTLPNNCSILPSRELCFYGHIMGGSTAIADPTDAAAHLRTCVVADGTPVQCVKDHKVVWDEDPDSRVVLRSDVSDDEILHGIKERLREPDE